MRYFDDSVPMTAARVLAEEMPRLMAHSQRNDQFGFWVARDRTWATSWVGSWRPPPRIGPYRQAGVPASTPGLGPGIDVEGILEMITMARAADMSSVVATTLATNLGSRWVLEEAGLQPAAGKRCRYLGPVPVIEHAEVVYTLDLSEAATLPG